MEHSVKLISFPNSWRSKREIMAVNTPKLKLLLVLEQSSNWGSVDQELHRCSYLQIPYAQQFTLTHMYFE